MTRSTTRSRLRALHVINTAEVGGGAEHLIHLTRGLEAHGFQSSVLAGRDGPAAPRLREIGVPVEVLGPLGLGAPIALATHLRRQRPDLVHLHGSRAGLAGALAARLARSRPVVYTAHAFSFQRRMPEPLRWAAAKAEAITSRLVDRVICLTRGDLDAAVAKGFASARLTVVPNGIDIARFPAPEDRRAELGLEPTAPVVGMIARLVPQKDPLAFVRMATRVADAVPEARFLVVGDGPLRAHVEEASSGLIGARRLVLTGLRSDVPELLATMDVVVSVALWEGLPLALLEAMAAERAVVASALPAHAEVIEDGESGVLVPADDPERLAAEVARLLCEPERRRAMGRRARERIERCYTVERMVADTAAVYRSLLPSSRDLQRA